MAAIKPQVIVGKWHKGFALDLHTTSSAHIGVDEFGHDRFQTTYSEIGELLYRLKYKADLSVMSEIVATVADFLRPSRSKLDLLVPVPPSKPRNIQPVLILAEAIGTALDLPVDLKCIRTTRTSTPIKDAGSLQDRRALVSGLYLADAVVAAKKNVLLFDDLYRSGATMNAITETLMTDGNASKVYALSLTKTRSHR